MAAVYQRQRSNSSASTTSTSSNSSGSIAGIFKPLSHIIKTHKTGSRNSLAELEDQIKITRAHFIDKSSRAVCKTRSCRSKFNLIRKPHNCYKCGEVFCTECLRQQRRLNRHAKFDPQGRFYKVCTLCFNSDMQGCGVTRSVMAAFRQARTHHIKNEVSINSQSEWSKAEERITEGFLAEVNSTSVIMRTVQSFTFNFGNSPWKKPDKAQAMVHDICWQCTKSFEIFLRPRHQCSICGAAVCTSCSKTDLIVYIPDEAQQEKTTARYQEAKLSLIYTPHGPEQEPNIHEYLRICNICIQTKLRKQEEMKTRTALKQHGERFWRYILPFYENLISDQKLIQEAMEKYKTLVRSLEDGTSRNSQETSNVKILSKAQIDLDDLLCNYLLSVNAMRKFTADSPSTEALLKNMQKAVGMFYMENKSQYCELKETLMEYLPLKVIDAVQNQVNRNALLCVDLLLRQLGYELLHHATVANDDRIIEVAKLIANAQELVELSLKEVVVREGDTDWDDHVKLSIQMTKTQVKEKPLIRVHEWFKSHPHYLMNEIVDRTCSTLDELNRQLLAKTTHSHYKDIKQLLADSKDRILNLVCTSHDPSSGA